jgi:putative addiction module CopG family antidote
MTIHLTEDLERFILDAVSTGRYAREDDVVRDALIRLRQALDESAETTERSPEPGQPGKQLTKREFHRHLVKIGLMDELPDPNAASANPDDQLIDYEGEIVSEVVIRERLIEWLVGFLGK